MKRADILSVEEFIHPARFYPPNVDLFIGSLDMGGITLRHSSQSRMQYFHVALSID